MSHVDIVTGFDNQQIFQLYTNTCTITMLLKITPSPPHTHKLLLIATHRCVGRATSLMYEMQRLQCKLFTVGVYLTIPGHHYKIHIQHNNKNNAFLLFYYNLYKMNLQHYQVSPYTMYHPISSAISTMTTCPNCHGSRLMAWDCVDVG